MTRPSDAVALGAWLVFLVGALASMLLFFGRAPELAGPGHWVLLSVGGGIGALLAIVVGWLRADMFRGLGWWRRFRLILGLGMIGIAGGATAAEHLNMALSSRGQVIVDRPIVARSVVHRRRAGEVHLVTTLAASRQLATDNVALTPTLWRRARPGLCLYSLVVRGRLGADWIDGRAVETCPAGRGVAASGVIVTNGADRWRWHRPDVRSGTATVVDHALPPGTRCVTWRDARWLYRCDPVATKRS